MKDSREIQNELLLGIRDYIARKVDVLGYDRSIPLKDSETQDSANNLVEALVYLHGAIEDLYSEASLFASGFEK